MGDALEVAKKNGYRIVTDKAEFMALKPGDGKVLSWNNWLQDGKAMPYVMDMTEKDITLPEFTAKAIEMLDNPEGFFLMVEGGKIDWACHANDGTAAIINNISFDEAVNVGLEFAKKHPEETLIVVTGDHECGGLTLGFAGTKYKSYFDILGRQNVSFQKFTDEVVALWKSEHEGGVDFDYIKPTISHYFGFKFEGDPKEDLMVLEDFQIAMLKDAYGRSFGGGEKAKGKEYILYGDYDPLTVTLTHILNQKAGLGWTSYKHTGVPVTTSAWGIGSETFNGYYDNTDLALKIMDIMGLPSKVHYVSGEAKLDVASN